MINKKIGLRRILKLADFVETIKPKRFDFAEIVGADWKGLANLSCGTTACAIGWATTMPLFRKLGLFMDKFGVGIGNSYEWKVIGLRLFGITSEAVYALFQPNNISDSELFGDYPVLDEKATPKQWAKHARKIVAILEKENESKIHWNIR